MADSEQIAGIYWNARLELGDLESDARAAQEIVDRLFERYANRTIDVRLRTDGGESGPLGAPVPSVRPSPGFGGAAAADQPGGAGFGDFARQTVLRVDTTEVDSALGKVNQLIAALATAAQAGSGLGTGVAPQNPLASGGGGGTVFSDAGLGAVRESAGDGPAGSFFARSVTPAGFGRRAVERKLLAAFEDQGGGYTVEDERRLEEATQGAGDPFTFAGEKTAGGKLRLPGEVRDYLEGALRGMRGLFRLAGPGERSGGPEAMSALGEDEYFAIAERIKGTPIRSAVEAAAQGQDPELQFLASYYKSLPGSRRGRGGADPLRMESVAASNLETGESLSIAGIEHTVTEPEEGERRLTSAGGLDVPLEALTNLPVDVGSRKRPSQASAESIEIGEPPVKEPFYTAPSSAAQTGIFGQPEIMGTGIGEQKPMFHTPVEAERPALTGEDARIAAQYDPTATPTMFGEGGTRPKTVKIEPEFDAAKAEAEFDEFRRRQSARPITVEMRPGESAPLADRPAPGFAPGTEGEALAAKLVKAGVDPDFARRFVEGSTLGSGGASPPGVPPSSRGFDFGDEGPSSAFASRFGRSGSPSLRPATPQEAAGMTRADIVGGLPAAGLVDEEGDPLDELAGAAAAGGGGGRRDGGGGAGIFASQRFGRFLAGGILTYGALRIAAAYQQEQIELGLNAGNVPAELQSRHQFLSTITSVPILGQIGEIGGTVLAHAMGRETLGEQEFHLTQVATDEAANTNRLRQQVNRANENSGFLTRAVEINTFGAFNRERVTVDRDRDDSRQALLSKETMMRAELGTQDMDRRKALQDDLAQHTGTPEQRAAILAELGPITDPNEWRRKQADLQSFQADLPAQLKAIDILHDTTLGDINRRIGLAQENIGRQSSELNAAIEGQPGKATNLQFERQLADQRAAALAAGLPTDVLDRVQAVQRGVRREEQEERLTETRAGTASMALELGRDPLGAQLNTIAEQRREALREAPYRAIAYPTVAEATIGSLGSRDYGSLSMQERGQLQAAQDAMTQARADAAFNAQATQTINARFDIQGKLAEQQFGDRRIDIDIGQETESGKFAALRRTPGLEPRPELARAIGIRGEAETEGLRLDRAGFRAEGHRAVELGEEKIGLERQEFLQSFRGTEINPNRVDLGNPRNFVDVPARLGELDAQLAALKKFDGGLDQAAGVSGGPLAAGAAASAMMAARGAGGGQADGNTVAGSNPHTFIQDLVQAFGVVLTS